MVQQPLQLGPRKIGIQHPSGGVLDPGSPALCTQRITTTGRAAILPDDGGRHGLPRGAVPHHGGFPLVGDTDRRDAGRLHPLLRQHLLHDLILGLPNLRGIVLHPARAWKYLPKRALRHGRHLPGTVKQDGPGTGGALVERKQVVHTGQA
jgi:hypothetical protein